MIFDPLYLVIILPGVLIGIWAQIKLSHAYGKYSQVPVESGMTSTGPRAKFSTKPVSMRCRWRKSPAS